jgi:hypothetical protein
MVIDHDLVLIPVDVEVNKPLNSLHRHVRMEVDVDADMREHECALAFVRPS